MTLHIRRGVHYEAMHADGDSFTVANKPAGGVKAMAGTNQAPVVLRYTVIIFRADIGEKTSTQRDLKSLQRGFLLWLSF